MFERDTINKESVTVVSTKKELRAAIKRKDPYIEVKGKLAKKIKWIGLLSGAQIAALIALLGTGAVATTTFPVATPAFVAAAADITGGEIAAIIFLLSLGITIIISILKDYDIKVEGENEFGKVSVVLNKKSS
jgi:hypothetical protein